MPGKMAHMSARETAVAGPPTLRQMVDTLGGLMAAAKTIATMIDSDDEESKLELEEALTVVQIALLRIEASIGE